MAGGTPEGFEHSPRSEWTCSVLRGEGLARTNDVIRASRPAGMPAAAASIAFISRHRKVRDGTAWLRMSAAEHALDFVVRVTWWPPACKYECAYAEWPGS